MTPAELTIRYVDLEFTISEFAAPAWDEAADVLIASNWDGTPAPAARHLRACLLWSETSLYVRFETNQTEPLVVAENPQVTEKTMNLWERDVCELFIAPDRHEPARYFEFEIAPTGEWLDLAINSTSGERITGRDYASGMESAARIEEDKVVMAIKIPFFGLGKTPRPGDIWMGNLFRCVGGGETRGYLAWQPTMTERANFHAPEAFGEFHFAG